METLHKYATGYCSCGLTWNTHRSGAVKYQDSIDVIRRAIRGHIVSPSMQGTLKKGEDHRVVLVEHKVQVFTK